MKAILGYYFSIIVEIRLLARKMLVEFLLCKLLNGNKKQVKSYFCTIKVQSLPHLGASDIPAMTRVIAVLGLVGTVIDSKIALMWCKTA